MTTLVNASKHNGVMVPELNAPPANTYSYEMMRELDALVGGYLSIGLVWQSDKTRMFGAPLTAAVFQRTENGVWEDFVGPLTLPAMLVNFAVGFFLPHLPSLVASRSRRRKQVAPEQRHG